MPQNSIAHQDLSETQFSSACTEVAASALGGPSFPQDEGIIAQAKKNVPAKDLVDFQQLLVPEEGVEPTRY
jgi:hypothetical protein